MYKTKQESVSSSVMELFIETLTGSSMILHVSPLDTVFDVKTYIQKLEGMIELSLLLPRSALVTSLAVSYFCIKMMVLFTKRRLMVM